MTHSPDSDELCNQSCPVGNAIAHVRLHINESPCPHSGINVCPSCANLTDDEVAAIRKYVDCLSSQDTT